MGVLMSFSSNFFVAVYQVLDAVLTDNVAPPGAKATIHGIIDDLHKVSASRELVAQAERISVEMHHLECATARGDFLLASRAREELRSIAACWLNYCAIA